MKYLITVLVTSVIVFLAATVYYKGLPRFDSPVGVSVVSTEEGAPNTDSEAGKVTPPADDKTAIAEIIKAALIKKYGPQSADVSVSVSEVNGEYAKGMVTEQGGGGMWFAARLNGTWTLVWDGNGTITCDEISPFPDFPTSMIPECYSTPSGQIVTR